MSQAPLIASPEHRLLRLCVCVSAVCVATLVIGLSWFELSGVDLGYHLAYGDQMLRTHEVVTVDPFIYGAQDHHFVNANWLSQVAFAAVWRAADWQGLVVLRTALIALLLSGVALLTRRAGGGGLAVVAAIWLATLGLYERFTLRPELVSYVILVWQLVVLVSAWRRGRLLRRDWLLLVLTQILWVNAHSYFIVGPILTACFVAGQLFTVLIGKVRGDVDSTEKAHPASLKAWLLLPLVMAGCCLINPAGLSGAVFPLGTLRYLQSESIMAQNPDEPVRSPWGIISEFQSPFGFFGYVGAWRTTWAFGAILALSVVGCAAAIRSRAIGALLALIVLAAMASQMRRNIALAATGCVPLAAAFIGLWWRDRCARRQQSPTKAFDAGRLAPFAVCSVLIVSSSIWCAGVWSGQFYFSERRPTRRLATGWSPRVFPRNAVVWINEQADLQPQLFTDLMVSSNVLPWMDSRFKVFITTNTFAYPQALLHQAWYVGMCTPDADYRKLFEAQGIHVVLLRAHDPTQPLIRSLMRDSNWVLTWFDADFVIFVRDVPEHASLISRSRRSSADLDVTKWIADAHRAHQSRGFQLGMMAAVPLALGWNEPARALLEEAVAAEPNYFEAWRNLGVCAGVALQAAIVSGDLTTAKVKFGVAGAAFTNSIASGSDDPAGCWNQLGSCHADYGRALLLAGKTSEAVAAMTESCQALERSVELRPTGGAWLALAVGRGNLLKSQLAAGDLSAADATWAALTTAAERATTLEPQTRPAVARVFGIARLDRGTARLLRQDRTAAQRELTEAARQFERLCMAVPDDVGAIRLWTSTVLAEARLLSDNGDESAEERFTFALELVESRDDALQDATGRLYGAECHAMLGRYALDRREWDRAQQHFEQAVAVIDPIISSDSMPADGYRVAAGAFRGLAAIYFERRDHEAANACLLRATACGQAADALSGAAPQQ